MENVIHKFCVNVGKIRDFVENVEELRKNIIFASMEILNNIEPNVVIPKNIWKSANMDMPFTNVYHAIYIGCAITNVENEAVQSASVKMSAYISGKNIVAENVWVVGYVPMVRERVYAKFAMVAHFVRVGN